MPGSCEDGREGTSWWSWHPRLGRAAPSTPQSGGISLYSQAKCAALGEGQRCLEAPPCSEALPVCGGRDPGRRSLTVQNRGLTCWKDRSGSSSLPSSRLCWGNGGPEQPRHQPKVTEARCRYERKPQRLTPRPELPGNAASVCSTGFSLLPQPLCLPWASGERRGVEAPVGAREEGSWSAVGLQQVSLWGKQWRADHSPPT